MGVRRVVVHVDRLVLKGFHNTDSRAIGEAMRGELSRLLADPTMGERLASLGHASRIQGGKVNLTEDPKPRRSGITVARAIAKGISR